MSATETTTETEDGPSIKNNNDVATLMEHMTVPEVRSWMSDNGLTRSRGARKLESLQEAAEQNAELVAEKASELQEASATAECSHCDFEETHESAKDAEEAAREHKSENPAHFPVARNSDGDGVYGV